MHILSSILWIGPPLVLQTALLWALTRDCHYKFFPWFFSYTLFSILAELVRLCSFPSGWLYFRVYWATEAGYAILGVAVVYEVYRTVFHGFLNLWWFRPIFPLMIAVAALLIFFHTRSLSPGLHVPLMNWIVAGELGVRLLQVTIFIVLVVLVPLFGLHWRQYPFGIAAGFGFYSTVALLGTMKYSEFGTKFTWAWGFLSVVAYIIAALIWLWYFTGPAPQPRHSTQPPLGLEELARYKKLLRKKQSQ